MMMTLNVVKDEWVRAAMTDDNVVVELLVRLKQAQAVPPAPIHAVAALKWGIRQPRSRRMLMRCDAKRHGDLNVHTRDSPTTPLSWSGGGGTASPSAADFEETSRHVLRSLPAASSRSKSTGAAAAAAAAANETTSTRTKRSRRKKTFAELKEEENLLLKERIHLKQEIASMRATCKEQRAMNENLKRIKLDLDLHTAKNSSLIADEPERIPSSQPRERVASSPHALEDDFSKALLDSCDVVKAMSGGESFFLLPDLNMMPADDDSGTETLCWTS